MYAFKKTHIILNDHCIDLPPLKNKFLVTDGHLLSIY